LMARAALNDSTVRAGQQLVKTLETGTIPSSILPEMKVWAKKYSEWVDLDNVTGSTLFQHSADDDFLRANAEFEQAVRIAPWWADIYFNDALGQQNAGNYKGAINNLKLFLLAAPDDPAVGEVRNRIYTLEAQIEKYAGVKRWEGKWQYGYSILKLTTKGDAATMVYVKVDKVDALYGHRPGDTQFRGSISNDKINGKRLTRSIDADTIRCFGKESEHEMTGQLRPDGQTIHIQYKGRVFTLSTCVTTRFNEYTDEYTRIP